MAFQSGVQAGGGSAQVKYAGHDESDALFVGRTIAQVRASRAASWNIPSDARAYRGRDVLPDDYVVRNGDVIEFHRRMGEKG